MAASGVKDFSGLNVLVLGGGPVGLAVLFNLRAKGLDGRIFVSEPTAKRAEMIKDIGLARAEDILNPTQSSVAKTVREALQGEGVDIVFDCAGAEPAMLAAMETLKIQGIYVNIAGWKSPFTIPMQYAFFREINIRFSLGNDDNDYREVVEDFVKGKFKGAEALITRRLPVEDLAEKGLDELIRNKDDHVKIVATWREDLLDKSPSNL